MNKANFTSGTVLQGLIFFIPVILFFSCTYRNKKNTSINTIQGKKDSVRRKPRCSFSDTIVIKFPSAVFYNPDTLQLEKMKEITPKNEYETEVHNCFYLMRNARMEMKKYWPKVHIIETSEYRYLLFLKGDKTKTIIDLDGIGDMCGIFLFDGRKEPELADMMNIDTALGFYFVH